MERQKLILEKTKVFLRFKRVLERVRSVGSMHDVVVSYSRGGIKLI